MSPFSMPVHAARQRASLIFVLFSILPFVSGVLFAQQENAKQNPLAAEGPKDPKAVKTFEMALEWQKKGDRGLALDEFRRAFKQDNGQCRLCLSKAFSLAMSIGAYKDAEEVARQWLPISPSDPETASVHYALGCALQQQGLLDPKKDKFFIESRDEFKAALALKPSITQTQYKLGVSLAYLHEDSEARAAFQHFLDLDTKFPSLHERAERFVDHVELARAKMAPPFDLTTLDGRHISMDSLAGKVVLIDFWATWCRPCRDALPHMRSIAHKFEGQPFVMLSISLDVDANNWKDYVAKNDMTWPQYRETGFGGKIAKLFNVNAIPATFSIDADGVLEDERVGDASIDGKLKKMIAQAVDLASRKPEAVLQSKGASE